MKKLWFVLFTLFFTALLSIYTQTEKKTAEQQSAEFFLTVSKKIPKDITDNIQKNKGEFYLHLKKVLEAETDGLLVLVDKIHLLDESYVPENIIRLYDVEKKAYHLDRDDIYLAAIAEPPLQKMALAAKKDGITLVVSSAYRPYEYQATLFNKYVKRNGLSKAKTYSAPAGASQHQLGTTIDFGTINDAFAKTPAGKWLFKNACKYGWSLSFPKGYEKVTGYKWESWHYRYIGVEACRFQKKWFNDIQQYMLEFIDEWKKAESGA